jgi:hypothetical protein
MRSQLDRRYTEVEKVVLVIDQLNPHLPVSLHEALDLAEAERLAGRLEIHHTPRHGSCLNKGQD